MFSKSINLLEDKQILLALSKTYNLSIKNEMNSAFIQGKLKLLGS